MIGWGIIGVGAVTELKAAPAIFRADDSDVVHVMRRDAAKAEDFAQRHGVGRWSSDAQAVLDDPDVTAVYIATPTSSHAPLALRALEAGKHVLVEKPFAMNAAEGRAVVEAAEAAGLHCWVAFYRRTLPRFKAMKQMIGDGAIGRPLSVQMTWRKPSNFTGWRWDPAINTGGEFFETACHTFDALDWLLGPARDAAGDATPDYSVVNATLRFGDVPASGSWTFGSPAWFDQTTIVGSEATLSFETLAPSPIKLVTADGEREVPVGDPPNVHGPMVVAILDELRGGDPAPSTGATALRTTAAMEDVLTHARA